MPDLNQTLVLSVVFQQAFNATVAINHMRKLQLAHSEQQVRIPVIVPDIKVVDVSSPPKTRKNLNPNLLEPKENTIGDHMALPPSSNELKSHHPLRTSQSEPHHAPCISEQEIGRAHV